MRKYRKLFCLALAIVLIITGIVAVYFTAEARDEHKQNHTKNRDEQDVQIDISGELDKMLDGQVGWLAIPGTDIAGPVMQADDNEYYLRRNESGEKDVWGCYFMDADCASTSQHLIIYGHSLDDSPDEDKFSQLKRFLTDAFSKEYGEVQLTYNGEAMQFRVFSAGYIAATAENASALNTNPTQEAAEQLIADALARSEQDFDVNVESSDMLLSLLTCTSDSQTRFIVTAVRVA